MSARLAGALVLVVACQNVSASEDSTLESPVTGQFQVMDWRGYNEVKALKDGTLLHHYIAETHSAQTADDTADAPLQLRISFLPRFQCSPLIDVIEPLPENLPSSERVDRVKRFNRLSISIDDEPMPFPTLVELLSDQVYGYYNAPLERRVTLRILLELGSRLQINYGADRVEVISLLGSRRALETALGRCKNHN